MKKISDLKLKSKNSYGLLRLFLKTIIFLSLFTYLVFSLLLYFEDPAIEISSPKIMPVDSNEDVLEIKKVNFANGGNYENGFLRVSSNKNSEIYLEESKNISNKNEAITIKNNMIYKGEGNQAVKIGRISQEQDKEKEELQIAFNNNSDSEDFNSIPLKSQKIDGWIIKNEPIKLGRDNIAGLNTPNNADIPKSPLGIYKDVEEFADLGIMTAQIRSRKDNPEDKYLALESKDVISEDKYSLTRGPYIYKEKPVYLSKGDEIEFEWKACSAQDIYTVYAYLVDVNTNHFQKLLDQCGSFHNMCMDWQKENVEVKRDGEYIIVFTAGSIDYSGGKALGASLYLDNIAFHKQNRMNLVTDDDLSQIAEKIRIKKDSTLESKEINLALSVQNNKGKISRLQRNYFVDEAEILAVNSEGNNNDFDSLVLADPEELKNMSADKKYNLLSNVKTANLNDESNKVSEELAEFIYRFTANLDLFIAQATNVYQRLLTAFENSFISLAADRNNHSQQTDPSNHINNLTTVSGFQEAAEVQKNTETEPSTDNYLNNSDLNKNSSETNKISDKKNTNQELVSNIETEKDQADVEIFSDNNGNGRIDLEDEKVGEVVEIELSKNKMYRDEEGNIHLYVDRNTNEEISLKVKLDFEKLEELEKRSEDESCNVIIKFD